MAANIKFYLLSDHSEVVSATPHELSPYILYKGMVSYIEYHEIYMRNVGTVLNNPTYALSSQGNALTGNYYNRKVTGSALNAATTYGDGTGDDSASELIAYATGGDIKRWWRTAEGYGPDSLGATWAADHSYEIYTKYICGGVDTTSGTYAFRHSVGGNEPT